MSYEDNPAPQPSADYLPDEIVLYGVKLNELRDRATLPFGKKRLHLEVREGNQVVGRNRLSIAVIYSYSYEGRCYRFERPKLMIFEGEKEETTRGCGYEGSGYDSWRMDSKRILMELNTKVDLAEVLVLEANLPGNRTPNTYGNHMQLAHRGSKLNRDGMP